MRRQATAVEARFTAEGEIEPKQFEWHGTPVAVEGLGRRWTEGRERCFTVIALGGRLFELRLDQDTLRWSVVGGPHPRLMV